jgi:hypothetical protein
MFFQPQNLSVIARRCHLSASEGRQAYVFVTLSLRRVQGKNLNSGFFARLRMTYRKRFPISSLFPSRQSGRCRGEAATEGLKASSRDVTFRLGCWTTSISHCHPERSEGSRGRILISRFFAPLRMTYRKRFPILSLFPSRPSGRWLA